MRYFLIMNPGSKGGKSARKLHKILSILDKNSITYDYKITHSLEDAYTYSVFANKKNYDVIVAIGGDGTINKVINGFYDVFGNKISNAKFAVIYTGTSPDFCKSYHIPTNLYKAIDVMLRQQSKKIKIGKITHKPSSNKHSNLTTNYFACCANFGLGATLAREANSGIRKYLGDNLGTFMSLIKTLLKYSPSDFTVIYDGKQKTLTKVFNLSVGITPFIASGIKVNNKLADTDNLFYILTIKNLEMKNLLSVLKIIYNGKKFVNNHFISLDYFSVVEVANNHINNEVEYDGDPQGFLPCKVEMAKDYLDLIC